MANEKRLIDANAVSECFRKEKVAILNHVIDPIKKEIAMVILHWCEDRVRDAPTVDAVEVVHGRWEARTDVIGFVRCSVCRDCNIYDDWLDGKKWSYCPNCGAKMDGERKDNDRQKKAD